VIMPPAKKAAAMSPAGKPDVGADGKN